MFRIELSQKQINHIKILVNDDYENGRRVIYQNPNATLLIEEWNKCIKVDLGILKELKEQPNQDKLGGKD